LFYQKIYNHPALVESIACIFRTDMVKGSN